MRPPARAAPFLPSPPSTPPRAGYAAATARSGDARCPRRARASSDLLLWGDSARAGAAPALPRDAATRALPLAERALAVGRPLVLITDGELDDPVDARVAPGGLARRRDSPRAGGRRGGGGARRAARGGGRRHDGGARDRARGRARRVRARRSRSWPGATSSRRCRSTRWRRGSSARSRCGGASKARFAAWRSRPS